MPKPDYSSAEWADVVPIPQDDGGPNPLAAIAYTEEYSQASDYLRAVMAANEKSERVLKLTEHIIGMNPAHYTVWIYRVSVLEHLGISPEQELEFLTSISLSHLKNYQIWHHRQVIISQIPAIPASEPQFLAMVLAKDAKNYHVWSYRQWLVAHFNLWADNGDATSHPEGLNGEIDYTAQLLDEDVRNNSAWNHRYYVVFSKPGRGTVSPDVVTREIDFAKSKVRVAPQNQSAWNYLQGIKRKTGQPSTTELKSFAEEFAPIERPEDIKSTHALDYLADLWVEDEEREKAIKAYDLLAETYDPIRKKYWMWRKNQMKLPAEVATS